MGWSPPVIRPFIKAKKISFPKGREEERKREREGGEERGRERRMRDEKEDEEERRGDISIFFFLVFGEAYINEFFKL